ncbi:unnamed protein product, partial [Striga asiatica]
IFGEMAVDMLEIGVKMRKGVIFTIRVSFRSVCNHPFLVGFLCFLILLYRSSPFIFSLLVSTSPILICTAVLLGVLLSYGEPNIPEIEIEEKKTSPIEEIEGRFLERLEGDLDDDATPLIDERSRVLESNVGEIWHENRDSSERVKIEEVLESDDEKLESNVNGIWHENGDSSERVKIEEVLESDDEKSSEADSFDSEKVNVDSLDSPPRSPWTRIEDREEEEVDDILHELKVKQEKEEDDYNDNDDDERVESSDSGSDCAESSSPDASMADILPMLDELHPLLDEDAPQPVDDVASSDKSSVRSHNSDDESETHDEAREEEIEGGSNSAITWTEEDQKNLMDLGSSEIERNQRLENLILRRRARKSVERNLIDLEGIDYPFGLTPILTRRQNNPFDLPHDDSYEDLGLPPIPGSAPSVLIQRRNPFDIPYDPNEEKPNLMGDGFKEEFSVFRRHEIFNNVGPSVFGPGRRDARMRPYFVPVGTISEESPSSSLFRRQSSGLSESKVSSAPETESIVSVEDLEDKKLSVEQEMEEAFEGPPGDQELISHQEKEDEEEEENRELEPISEIVNVLEHVGHQEKEDDDEEEEDRELEPISEIVNVSEHVGHQEEEDDEEEENRELEPISEIVNVSEHVGHGSQSSDDEESLELDQVERRDLEEDQLRDVADHFGPESVTVQATEYNSNYEGGEQAYRRESSSSSLSEVSERVFTEIESGNTYGVAQEPGILNQTSIESTNSGNLLVDVPQRVPVYDLSPRHIEHNIEILPETVDSRENNNVSTDFSEVGKESDKIESSSVDPGFIPEIPISLKSGVETFVEENLVEEHGLREVSGSRGEECIRDVDEESSKERFEVRGRFSEGLMRDEHAMGNEEDRGTVQSQESDADAYERADEKSMPSVEGNSYPFDVAREMHVPHSGHLDEVRELSVLVESSEDVQLITEEVDDIKDIDEELLSELDNVGDFSVNQWGPGSGEIEKRIDYYSVEEIFEQDIQISNTRGAADIDLDESDKIEDEAAHLEKSKEEVVDIHEQEVEAKIGSVDHFASLEREDNLSGIPETEVQPDEKNVSFLVKDEVALVELEATKIEDIDLAFKEVVTSKELYESEPVVQETLAEEKIESFSNKAAELASIENEITYQGQVDMETTFQMDELEAHKIKNDDLEIIEITSSKEPPLKANPVSQEALPDEKIESFSNTAELASVENEITYQDEVDTETKSEMIELEASKIEDIDLALKKTITGTKPVEEEPVVQETLADEKIDSFPSKLELVELEASKIEDINMAIKEITSKDSPKAELALKETLAEHSKKDALNESSSETELTHNTLAVEVRQVEKDNNLVSNQSLSDPVDCAQKTSSEMIVLSEGTTSLPLADEVLGKSLEHDESIGVEANKVGPAVIDSSVQEISVEVEKPDDQDEAPKGKISRSSSSSSSSSSESSSSDSEKE